MTNDTPDAVEEVRAAVKAEYYRGLPGFDWCGGCGTGRRALTEDDARWVTESMERAWSEGVDRLVTLEALGWIMEMHSRAKVWTCECKPPREPKLPPPPTGGFYLYRLWGEEDRLLYVGVSCRLRSRLRTHRRRWGALIDHATWEEHASEKAMLDAEREAIREEDPALNRAGT